MSKATILSTLKMTNKPAKASTDPIVARREKLLTRLQEQREIALCFVDGKVYTAPDKQRVKINAETGEKTTESTPKRVKAWFSGSADNIVLEVRYGNVPIELAPGKTAVEVGKIARLIPTIETVIEAVKAGEVDELLKAIKKPART
ncbi:DUF6641 family protein [Duganella sp. HH105]|uniref:DUF6641 family protein n=1 Tax=Duganella sp. HH105 TaxID=1781067 RepID=UPI000877E7AD|nr:DUF6641 family protein [Duganella sp. HH105]OEZ55671.1 hypothetical protein DUGA6_53250 [Duganella sp. HH105]